MVQRRRRQLVFPMAGATFNGGQQNTANDIDDRISSWNSGYTGAAPYQLDMNLIGPVGGNSENMNGNTLQPDYAPQGVYGASTGGGTGAHETVVGYYASQIEQVQRDYSAAAFFCERLMTEPLEHHAHAGGNSFVTTLTKKAGPAPVWVYVLIGGVVLGCHRISSEKEQDYCRCCARFHFWFFRIWVYEYEQRRR